MYAWLEGTVGEKYSNLARIPAVFLWEAADLGPFLIVAPWPTWAFPTSQDKSMGGLTLVAGNH